MGEKCCVRCGAYTVKLSFCSGCGLPICDDCTPGHPCDDEEEPALTQPTPPGRFIVFEGGEGSGKTTQAAALAGRLEAQGHTITATREPGGTPTGERIRTLLLHSDPDELTHEAEALLFLAARSTHAHHVIRPALQRGHVVVCDRYTDSTSAYQGAGRGLGPHRLVEMSRWATGNLEPDLVIVLDIDPTTGLARSARRNTPDRIEREDLAFHERARSRFLELASLGKTQRKLGTGHTRYITLDATQPASNLGGQIWEHVTALLAEEVPA